MNITIRKTQEILEIKNGFSVTLSQVAEAIRGIDIPSRYYVSRGSTAYVRISDILNGKINFENIKYIDPEHQPEIRNWNPQLVYLYLHAVHSQINYQ